MLLRRQSVRAFLRNVSFSIFAGKLQSEIRGAKTLSAHEQPRRAAGWGFGGCKGDKGARFASRAPLSPLRRQATS